MDKLITEQNCDLPKDVDSSDRGSKEHTYHFDALSEVSARLQPHCDVGSYRGRAFADRSWHHCSVIDRDISIVSIVEHQALMHGQRVLSFTLSCLKLIRSMTHFVRCHDHDGNQHLVCQNSLSVVN